jgi:hypothetical protein
MRDDLPTVVIAAAVAAVAMSLAVAAPVMAGGPFQYFAVTPCRVVDSRTVNATEGTDGTPLSNGLHDFRVQGQCGIPNGALAITGNFTIVNPTGAGHLTIYPANVAVTPDISTLNFLPGDVIANGAIVPLGPVSVAGDKDLAARISQPVDPHAAHLVIDVTGYFQ